MIVWAITHLAAAAAYAGFAVVLLLRAVRTRTTLALAGAAGATALWAGSLAALRLAGHPVWPLATETLRDAGWFLVALVLLRPALPSRRILLSFAAAAGAVLLADLVFALRPGLGFTLGGLAIGSAATRIASAVTGLVLVEILLRNTSRAGFWAVKHLGLALICLFGYELLLRVPELLVRVPNEDLLVARPLIYLLILPLLVVSAVRSARTQLRVHSSRRVVLHSVTFICVGILLQGTALAALYVRAFGGSSGTVLAVVIGFAGLIGTAVALGSTSLRSRLSLFINENFFSYRYDYRLEWEKFIRSLSSGEEGGVASRALRTLGELLDSPGGVLWLRQDQGRRLVPAARSTSRAQPVALRADDPALAPFADEALACLELGPEATVWRQQLPTGWLAVPFRYRAELIALAVLEQPRVPRRLDWEDRNLVRLVAWQLAAHLAQEEMAEALAEARQFEQFNKRFAFIAHDVKNIAGQLGLLVHNVALYGEDAEFREDLVATLRGSVTRLQELLALMKGEPAVAPAAPGRPPVDVARLVAEFVEAKRGLGLALRLAGEGGPLPAAVDAAALGRVLEHVVQNAREAGPTDAEITVRLAGTGEAIRISVIDRGRGMSRDFIERELFRPMRSTKGGYGIGAYQAREIMREMGGDIEVSSVVGQGTTVDLLVPLPPALARAVGA